MIKSSELAQALAPTTTLRAYLTLPATYLDAQRLAVAYGLDWGTDELTGRRFVALSTPDAAAHRRALVRLIELGFTHAEEHDDV